MDAIRSVSHSFLSPTSPERQRRESTNANPSQEGDKMERGDLLAAIASSLNPRGSLRKVPSKDSSSSSGKDDDKINSPTSNLHRAMFLNLEKDRDPTDVDKDRPASPHVRKTQVGSRIVSPPDSPSSGAKKRLAEGNAKKDKRQLVIEELVSTEEDYVKDLENCIVYYLKPVRQQKLLDAKTLDSIFSCMEVIFSVNKDLLKEFSLSSTAMTASGESSISDLAWQSTNLMVYEHFLKNYTRSHITLKNCVKKFPSFGHFCENQRVSVKELKLLHLRDFLIKPVQRICKYPLFVKELLSVTPEGSPEWRTLRTCLSKMEEVINLLNDSKRQEETIESVAQRLDGFGSVLSIPGRFLCKEGKLIRYDQHWEKPKERYYFLFNDILIDAKVKKGFMAGKGRESYEFVSKTPLSQLKVRESSQEDPLLSPSTKAGMYLFTLEILSHAPAPTTSLSAPSTFSALSPSSVLTAPISPRASNQSLANPTVAKVWHIGASSENDKMAWIYELSTRAKAFLPAQSMDATDAASTTVNRSIVQEPPGSKRSRKPSEVVPYIRIFLGAQELANSSGLESGSETPRVEATTTKDTPKDKTAATPRTPIEEETQKVSVPSSPADVADESSVNAQLAELRRMMERLQEEDRVRGAELRTFERLFNEERQKRVDLETEVTDLKQRLNVEKIKRESSANILEKMLQDEEKRRRTNEVRLSKLEKDLLDWSSDTGGGGGSGSGLRLPTSKGSHRLTAAKSAASIISLFRSDTKDESQPSSREGSTVDTTSHDDVSDDDEGSEVPLELLEALRESTASSKKEGGSGIAGDSQQQHHLTKDVAELKRFQEKMEGMHLSRQLRKLGKEQRNLLAQVSTWRGDNLQVEETVMLLGNRMDEVELLLGRIDAVLTVQLHSVARQRDSTPTITTPITPDRNREKEEHHARGRREQEKEREKRDREREKDRGDREREKDEKDRDRDRERHATLAPKDKSGSHHRIKREASFFKEKTRDKDMAAPMRVFPKEV